MDFTGVEFPNHVSFAHQALFRADFSGTVFKAGADFRETAFAGNTTFNKAKFLATGAGLSNEARFSGSSFHGGALFPDMQFPNTTRFDGSGLSDGFAAFW